MSDLIIHTTAARKRRNLTIQFCITALVVTGIIVAVVTFLVHSQFREQRMGVGLEEIARVINDNVLIGINGKITKADSPRLSDYWQSIAQLSGVEGGAFFDVNRQLLWSSQPGFALTGLERSTFQQVLNDPRHSQIVDNHVPNLNSLRGFFGDRSEPVTGLIAIRDNQGAALGMLKLKRTYEYVLEGVEQTVWKLLWYLLGGNLLLFLALFYNLRRGFKTVEAQEEELNQQISRLSNLLSINTSLQNNMKSASRRAVELNEQFLKRVGSDLH
ncbi:MAG: hypothetical protein HKN85_12940, partial [Gammaproteobacteria bacterium]|nr:hypothetical protein [Gammaproteobacteria bacterium]